MFVRPSARKSLSLPRTQTLRRPQLSSRCPSLQTPATMPSRRPLVTRPDLLPWRRRTNAPVTPGSLHDSRLLATAMDDSRTRALSSAYPPPPPPLPRSLYELRPFDPSKPLLVTEAEDPLPRSRMSPAGVPGEADSMMSVFEACIQVDQLDRAAAVLKRFGDMNVLSGDELIRLHNDFLRANVEQFYNRPNLKWAESMRSWYETRIRAMGLPQNAETIAYMLKVSLLSNYETPQLERLVNRYMGMLPGDAGLEVFTFSSILSDQDLATITGLCTTHNIDPDAFVELPMEEEPDLSELINDSLSAESIATTNHSVPGTGEYEVLPVPQKGLGLKSLREVLSFFSDIKGRDLSGLSHNERREVQSRLERDCVEAAIRRWREENEALKKMGQNSSLSTTALNSQLYDWQLALEARLQDEFTSFGESENRSVKNQDDMGRCVYGPFMRQSTPARLAAVTILSILNTIAQQGADNGALIAQTIQTLGKAVEEDIRSQQRDSERSAARKGRNAEYARKRVLKQTPIEAGSPEAGSPPPTQPLEADPATNQSNIVQAPKFDTATWPVYVRTQLGAALISALIDTAKVTVRREHPETKKMVSQLQPAFAHTAVFKKGKRVGMIAPNKFLSDLLKREPRADFLARHLPMLVEPEPWTKFDKGGFINSPATVIRVKHGEIDQKIYAEAAIKRGDMEQVCKGLDVLGKTAWKINQPVLDVMLQAWNSGEAIGGIPPLNPDIPTPAEPEVHDDPMQRRNWIRAVKAAENEKSGLHSERCFMNFQLEIANAFKEQTFYFPHNMDFRGRAYPIPTYLNHMGADNTRGLLQFSQGKTLGESGLRWLKVHLANVFGFDKASISEREQFAMDNLENIRDSVVNPLNGNGWWLKAEDNWQCLATCFELKAAMDLPDPTQYVSHLPVHQDGTCNGLQHYAALGGDLWGAQQVNLVPGDRPADVYSAVANLVKESVAEDVKLDNFLAKAVDGKITRKVVKQTVMTNVYGVTYIGARAQVQKQLEAAYPHIEAETGIPPLLLASYLAVKIFKALSSMFRGAHDIQYWLGECAGRVCKALTPEQMDRIEQGPAKVGGRKKMAGVKKLSPTDDLLSQFRSTIVWTTPLRLPVVQPYRKTATRVITTSLQDLNLQVPDRADPVNRRKQLQAFPPNFIHSLDATHMLLSALECHELGLQFAAVHDSFWTHAGDVDVMNRVLRDSFIRIHSENVIERLASEFEARYKGSLYLAKVPPGSPAEKDIRAHRTSVKLSLKDELLQERERLRLLSSDNPADVEKGTNMKTPASILEAHEAADESVAAEDMEDVGLGKLPSVEAILKSQETEEGDEKTTELRPGENPQYAQSLMQAGHFEKTVTGKKRKSVNTRVTNIWLPLKIPTIPKKGDFDVSELKTSQYFFS
ncbi:DNA-directed RNA polymerase [Apiospora saccharicola]|uniref:DNA-directed RNA polymerase n=1 Tax=Apiospora saccharicola TaxID=335842 RepID=A0ABR1UN37_9PEZI